MNEKIKKLEAALNNPQATPEMKAKFKAAIDKLKAEEKPEKQEKPKSAPKVKKVVAEEREKEKREKETKEEAAERKRKYQEEIQAQFNKIVNGGDLSLQEVVKIGRHIESMRSIYSQVVDEGSDNKNRLTPTKENLIRWMKAPNKFDLIGVDTATKTDATADLKHVKKETIFRLLGVKNKP